MAILGIWGSPAAQECITLSNANPTTLAPLATPTTLALLANFLGLIFFLKPNFFFGIAIDIVWSNDGEGYYMYLLIN